MEPPAFGRTDKMASENDLRPKAEKPDKSPRIKRREGIFEVVDMDCFGPIAQ